MGPSTRAALLGALLAGHLLAHGGQYSGPGEIVPPSTGGASSSGGPKGPGTPGRGPRTPGGSGAVTPSTTAPGAAGWSGTPSLGAPVGEDITTWSVWWEIHENRYLRLRDSLFATGPAPAPEDVLLGRARGRPEPPERPTAQDLSKRVVPALVAALTGSGDRDILSGTMVALAKIGKNPAAIDILALLRSKLTSLDQELRETAALAMGITHRAAALDDLVHLALDDELGRALVGGRKVDDRTRAFAIHGLGLLARAHPRRDIKDRVRDTCSDLLLAGNMPGRDVPVALVITLGQLDYDLQDQAFGVLSTLRTLEVCYDELADPGRQLIQAHVPAAVAHILGTSPRDRFVKDQSRWRQRLLADLTGMRGGQRLHHSLPQSCALALGRMSAAVDDPQQANPLDEAVRRALVHQSVVAKDHQTRAFCLLGLAHMGGARCRADLLSAWQRGNKSIEKPWAALALGVWAHGRAESVRAAGGNAAVDREIGLLLEHALATNANPSAKGAFAIALGLTGFRDAADTLRVQLQQHLEKEELAGHLCIGLALLGDHGSIEDLREIVTRSIRRPTLLRRASMALGRLGDPKARELLLGLLHEGDTNLAKMSALATGLGLIGDRRTLKPLLEMLADHRLTALSRAFAATALGSIGDKEELRWSDGIVRHLNYRAAVDTLIGSNAGILDIL